MAKNQLPNAFANGNVKCLVRIWQNSRDHKVTRGVVAGTNRFSRRRKDVGACFVELNAREIHRQAGVLHNKR